MALITCTECGKEISDKASSCIHCGCPMSEIRPTKDLWACPYCGEITEGEETNCWLCKRPMIDVSTYKGSTDLNERNEKIRTEKLQRNQKFDQNAWDRRLLYEKTLTSEDTIENKTMCVCPRCGYFESVIEGTLCDNCATPMTDGEFDKLPISWGSMTLEEQSRYIELIWKKHTFSSNIFSRSEWVAWLDKSNTYGRMAYGINGYGSSKIITPPISQTPKPKCPTCSSTNLKKMTVLERGTSIALWGLLSKKIHKTFKCNDCGYIW